MNGFKIALIVWIALGMLAAIANIGKVRKPTTPEIAVWIVVLSAVQAALVLAA